MGRAKKPEIKFSVIVYVQRVQDGDDSYLVVSENVDGVDLDNGPVVGEYELIRIVNVLQGNRRIEEME